LLRDLLVPGALLRQTDPTMGDDGLVSYEYVVCLVINVEQDQGTENKLRATLLLTGSKRTPESARVKSVSFEKDAAANNITWWRM